MNRCPWPGEDPLMVRYHDTEWGVPTRDDRVHFEFLVLESAQSGLSWRTILNKREGYRRRFAGFDPAVVATFGEAEIADMLTDTGIVRNRAKVVAAVNNAARFLEIQREFGTFSEWLWQFTDGQPVVNAWKSTSEIPATTPLSDKVAAELKKRGFKFLGSTVMYSHIQATGLVNDHLVSCFRRG